MTLIDGLFFTLGAIDWIKNKNECNWHTKIDNLGKIWRYFRRWLTNIFQNGQKT